MLSSQNRTTEPAANLPGYELRLPGQRTVPLSAFQGWVRSLRGLRWKIRYSSVWMGIVFAIILIALLMIAPPASSGQRGPYLTYDHLSAPQSAPGQAANPEIQLNMPLNGR